MTICATPSRQQEGLLLPQALIDNSTLYTDDTGFTVNIPPGWIAVDHNNTSQEAKEIASSQLKETLLEFCPPKQGIVVNSTNAVRCNDDFGIIRVSRYVNMDTNADFARGASSIDPSTGLIVMNLTAQDLVDFHDRSSPSMNIVQSKDILVNISDTDSGGTESRIPGKLVLVGNQINQLGWIQLFFVDGTDGYETTYIAPKGREGQTEPLSIFGIGLDRLPEELQPVMQIMTSASLQRPPNG